MHDAVKAALEQARLSKALGSSLECSVAISMEDSQATAVLEEYADELDAMFVVSSVELNNPLPTDPRWCYTRDIILQGEAKGSVQIFPPKQCKCSRCWRYLSPVEDGLCGRCEDVVASIPQ